MSLSTGISIFKFTVMDQIMSSSKFCNELEFVTSIKNLGVNINGRFKIRELECFLRKMMNTVQNENLHLVYPSILPLLIDNSDFRRKHRFHAPPLYPRLFEVSVLSGNDP